MDVEAQENMPEVVDLEDEEDNAVEVQLEGDDKEDKDASGTDKDEQNSKELNDNTDVEMADIKPKEENIEPDTAVKKVKKKKAAKKGHAVFVANVPFSATEEDIRKHFSVINDDIVQVSIFKFRRGTSKGSCLLEFTKKESYDIAMKMNLTKMKDRTIKIHHGELEEKKKKDKYTLDLQMRRRKILGEKKRIKQSRWKIRRIPHKMKKMGL